MNKKQPRHVHRNNTNLHLFLLDQRYPLERSRLSIPAHSQSDRQQHSACCNCHRSMHTKKKRKKSVTHVPGAASIRHRSGGKSCQAPYIWPSIAHTCSIDSAFPSLSRVSSVLSSSLCLPSRLIDSTSISAAAKSLRSSASLCAGYQSRGNRESHYSRHTKKQNRLTVVVRSGNKTLAYSLLNANVLDNV